MSDGLPQGWATAKLNDVVSFALGGDWGKDPDDSSDGLAKVRVIRGTEFKTWRTEKGTSAAERRIKVSSLEKRRLQKGDLVLEVSGGGPNQPVGRTVLIDDETLKRADSPLVCSNFFRLLRLYPEIDSNFLSHALSCAYARGEFNEFQTETTNLRNLNVTDFLEKTDVALAPVAEQQRIVAKLETLLGKVDGCQQRLAKIPGLLKRFRQSVLAAACSGRLTADWREENEGESASALLEAIEQRRNAWFKQRDATGNREARRLQSKLDGHEFNAPDDELPNSWIWASLLKACWLVVDCHNKTAPYESEGVPLIRTTNVRGGKLLLDSVKFVSDKTYAFWSRRCPPQPGDVLFSREAPMGECAVIPPGMKLCMGQRMMLLRVFPEYFSPQFLSFVIQDPKFQERLNGDAVGSGVKHLRVGDVEKLAVPVPPLAEQQEIVRRVEGLFALADQIEARFTQARAQVEKLTPSLLAKAFRGQLVPQNPTDEPAEKLLERIRLGAKE